MKTIIFYGFLVSLSIVSCGSASHRHSTDHQGFSFSEESPHQNLCTNCKGGLTQKDFLDVIRSVYEAYFRVVEDVAHTRLKAESMWASNELRAEASRMSGNWEMRLAGGFARRPDMTKDAFTLLVCHELGHLMGGFPSNWAPEDPDVDKAELPPEGYWAPDAVTSSEGQSDYFASQACAKKLWRDQIDINARIRGGIPAVGQSRCDAVYKNADEQNLCYRILVAAKDLLDVFVNAKNEARHDSVSGLPSPGRTSPVSFDEMDHSQVEMTSLKHPAEQCRLDTLIAGALCQVPWNDSIIPGFNKGITRNNREAELQAAAQSCTEYGGQKQGLRPRCWFKPAI